MLSYLKYFFLLFFNKSNFLAVKKKQNDQKSWSFPKTLVKKLGFIHCNMFYRFILSIKPITFNLSIEFSSLNIITTTPLTESRTNQCFIKGK